METASHLVSFDSDDTTLIAMDNCASNHIFGDPTDFIGGIIPMDPIDVTGLGNVQATGYGNVSIAFRCDKGQQHNKILHNVWYSPSAPIRMISIPQLDADLDERTKGLTRASIFSCGPFSIFKWGDITLMIPHWPPSRIPLLPVIVKNNNDNFMLHSHARSVTHLSKMPSVFLADKNLKMTNLIFLNHPPPQRMR